MSIEDEELALFVPENDVQLTKKINALLSNDYTRLNGFKFCCKYVNLISNDTLSEFIPGVILILQSCMVSGSFEIKQQCCQLYIVLINISRKNPDLRHCFSQTFISQIISTLLKSQDQWRLHALKCLKCVLSNFNTQCGNAVSNLENFLITSLFSTSSSCRILASQCFPWLSVAGGSGSNNSKYVAAWGKYIHSVVASLHEILNVIAEDSPELESSVFHNGSVEPLNLPPLAYSKNKLLAVVERYNAVSMCLDRMISTPLPIFVKMPNHSILKALTRTVATCTLFSLKFVDRAYLFPSIMQLLKDSLTVLQKMMKVARKNLLPHASIIIKLIINCFDICCDDSKMKFHQDILWQSRTTIHSTLKTWLMISGCASGINKSSQYFIKEISKDIQLEENQIYLLSVEKKGRNKQKNKFGNVDFLKTWNKKAKGFITLSQTHLCWAALQSLEAMVVCVGDVLPKDSFDKIFDTTSSLIIKFQDESNEIPNMYTNPDCRCALYSVLQACVVSGCAQRTISLSAAIQLFNVGLHDKNFNVSFQCQKAMNICELIVHPKIPSLAIRNSHDEEKRNETEEISIVHQSMLDSSMNVSLKSSNRLFSSSVDDDEQSSLFNLTQSSDILSNSVAENSESTAENVSVSVFHDQNEGMVDDDEQEPMRIRKRKSSTEENMNAKSLKLPDIESNNPMIDINSMDENVMAENSLKCGRSENDTMPTNGHEDFTHLRNNKIIEPEEDEVICTAEDETLDDIMRTFVDISPDE